MSHSRWRLLKHIRTVVVGKTARLCLAVLAIALTLLVIMSGSAERISTPDAPSDRLTAQETARLQFHVSRGGSIVTNVDTPFPQREVGLPPEVVEMHRKKRVATIEYCLGATKQGPPLEAQTAAAFAVALEEDPASPVALRILYGDLTSFDERETPDRPTTREQLIDLVEKARARAKQEATGLHR